MLKSSIGAAYLYTTTNIGWHHVTHVLKEQMSLFVCFELQKQTGSQKLTHTLVLV